MTKKKKSYTKTYKSERDALKRTVRKLKMRLELLIDYVERQTQIGSGLLRCERDRAKTLLEKVEKMK